jgi:cytidine deaminase
MSCLMTLRVRNETLLYTYSKFAVGAALSTQALCFKGINVEKH